MGKRAEHSAATSYGRNLTGHRSATIKHNGIQLQKAQRKRKDELGARQALRLCAVA
jgi:hypothetical protein